MKKSNPDTSNPRSSPIYLTKEEAERNFDEIVEIIRRDLIKLRGKLHDVQYMWPGWRESIDMADGGLTCVIMALYAGVEEYKSVKKKTPKLPDFRLDMSKCIYK